MCLPIGLLSSGPFSIHCHIIIRRYITGVNKKLVAHVASAARGKLPVNNNIQLVYKCMRLNANGVK